jgi:hypothetical protein
VQRGVEQVTEEAVRNIVKCELSDEKRRISNIFLIHEYRLQIRYIISNERYINK